MRLAKNSTININVMEQKGFYTKSLFERREDLLRVYLYSENYTERRDNWHEVEDGLRSNSWRFKFPTIYSSYRCVNPIVAYYNELQKVKFTLKKNHPHRKWVESIIKHKDWRTDILSAIRADIITIDQFLEKWPRVEEAIYLRLRFIDCLKTFK